MSGLVLVVEDRRDVRELLAGELEDAGLRVVTAADGVQGWACYRRAEPDLVVTDLRMPRSDGIDLLRRIREVANTPVIVLTAHRDGAISLVARASGAEELMSFPDDLDRLIARSRRLADSATGLAPSDFLAGSSTRIRRVRDQIARRGIERTPVLVRAPSPRGRESVVAELHARSAEPGADLVRVEASSLDDALAAGAASVHLERVETLSSAAQGRLRELLEGHPEASPRILASTAVRIDTLARAGSFDPRLAAILEGSVIDLPPLRERPDDLRDLVPALVRRLARILGRPAPRVPAPVVTALRSFEWPGDLDQLADVLERVVRRATSGIVSLADVEAEVGAHTPGPQSLREHHEERQRVELRALAAECAGNLAEMARRLGVSRGSVVYRLKMLGIATRADGA